VPVQYIITNNRTSSSFSESEHEWLSGPTVGTTGIVITILTNYTKSLYYGLNSFTVIAVNFLLSNYSLLGAGKEYSEDSTDKTGNKMGG
jgi:hypothetical protein